MNKTAVLKIRRVTEKDGRLLWEWVNDPGVRSSAFSSEPILWPAHEVWLRGKLQDPGCIFLIVTDEEDRPLGQVRFDRIEEETVETDMSVAPSFRGQGLGPRVLIRACEELQAISRQVRTLTAAIKLENRASIRTFEKAGFQHQRRRSIKGNEAIVMSLEIPSQ